MADRDLSEFFNDGDLKYKNIPSKKYPAPEGKTYRVPSPDGRTGLFFTQLAELGVVAAVTPAVDVDKKLELDDEEEREFLPLVLGCGGECRKPPADDPDGKPVICGSAFDQMLDDGVSWSLIKKIGEDAFVCFGINEQFADAINGVEGKAVAVANRAEKRAAARAAKKTSSASKAGSSSSRASGAKSTRTTPARTRGSAAPAKKVPAKKTA